MSNMQAIIQQFDASVIPSYARRPIVFVRGKGAKLWDADGKVYLDFLAGISVLNVGHCHPAVTAAITRQAGRLTHVSNLYYTEPQGALARKLAGLALGGKCFFCNSGAEANEALIKLARLWGHDSNRFEIVTLTNSFHGRTLATLTATGQDKVKKGFDPLPAGFAHAAFNDLDSVREALTPRTAAVLVEAVQGEGGIVPADAAFLQGLRALCDERGLLLLCDEIQCGLGRTGKWFGFQHAGIEPDAFSLAKSLGSGLPIGAIVTGSKLADVFQPGTHATTFGGGPLACAAALATLETIENENLVQASLEQGARFKEGLTALKAKYEPIGEVRGLGLMLGLELNEPARPMEDRLLEEGLICLTTAERVLRFLPPLNVKPAEIDEALEILDDTMAAAWGAPA